MDYPNKEAYISGIDEKLCDRLKEFSQHLFEHIIKSGSQRQMNISDGLGSFLQQRPKINLENPIPYSKEASIPIMNMKQDVQIGAHLATPDTCSNLRDAKTTSYAMQYSSQYMSHDNSVDYPSTPGGPFKQNTCQSYPGWDSSDVLPSPHSPTLRGQFFDVDASASSIHLNRESFESPMEILEQLIGVLNQTYKTQHKSTQPYNTLKDAEQKYRDFVPLFSTINGNNFKELLAAALSACLHQFSLDDFFNLVYNLKKPGQASSTIDDLNINRSKQADSRLEGLKFCHLILETFRKPSYGWCSPHMIQNLLGSSAKFQEICKNFLAMKIIFDSVTVIDDSPIDIYYLSRVSVYKAYYIICKKLTQKYSINPNSADLAPNLILSQSQLGKIFKLCFPRVSAKRLGKNSGSAYHYQGVIWNDLVIDQEMKRLIDLSLLDVQYTFRNSHDGTAKKRSKSEITCLPREVKKLATEAVSNTQILRLSNKKPIYSFVYLSSTYCVSDCLPRSLQKIAGHVPRQSEWAKRLMLNSVKALKPKIDVGPLICKITATKYCAETVDSFLEDVLQMIRYLMENFSPEEECLHLYLVVLTLIFPMAFSSEKEMSNRQKVHLRKSLSNFVTRLEAFPMSLSFDCNLRCFTQIIKKMINFNTLILSRYRTSSTKSIIKAMIGDSRVKLSSDENLFGDIILREAAKACNAFNWEFLDENLEKGTTPEKVLQDIVHAYMKLTRNGSENVLRIPQFMSYEDLESPMYDLLYYIFEGMVKSFHEVFLIQKSMLQLPMKLLGPFLSSITTEFQNLNFRLYPDREQELSREIFRAWWVQSSAVQEYTDILSEITALSMRLS